MSSLSSGDESQENVSNPPIAAYVTFETFEDLLRARKLLKQSKNLAQKEISFNHIDFETCPNPGSIIWENRENTCRGKAIRAALWLIFIALFLVLNRL